MISKVFTKFIVIMVMIVSCPAKIDIAIIGGGIGGASSAYFLNKMEQNQVNIDLYEANKIGGRLATIEYNGNYFENGGSIIHSRNMLMKHFVNELGLEEKTQCSDSFGIYNGSNMLFKSSLYDYVTAFKLWWSYGNDIFRLSSYTSQMIDSFSRLYHNCPKCIFNTTDDVISYASKDLKESLNFSTYEGLINQGFSKKFINEVIASIIRCNYCQSTHIHCFVGSVAIAGAGSELWSVKGGNWQVADGLIKNSGVNFINKRVKSISASKVESKINVSTSSENKLYDYVVVATPLTEKSNINFYGFNGKSPEKEKFHKTICTFIKGEINENFFTTDGKTLPDTILFTDKYLFNAISKTNPVDSSCNPENQIWKIFSDSKLSNSLLEKVFKSYLVISVTDWLAYPEYSSVALKKSFYLFEDVKNIFYVNAVEALSSAMEMSALGGRNVASLISRSINTSNHLNKQSTFHFVDEL